MQNRKIIEGELCVYRDGYIKQDLCASVVLDDGKVLYFYPAPKCFDNLIIDGQKNFARVRFTVDRDTGKNPRSAALLSQPRSGLTC